MWEWLRVLEEGGGGGIYRRAARGRSGSTGGHLSTAPGDERRQRERGKRTELTRELLASADEHRGEGEDDEHSAQCTVFFAGPCPCPLRRAPALASARVELREWRRGWWRGLACSGRLGSEHALNRALGGTQSACFACQHARTNAVTA